jgi:hypothetical protein
MQTGGNSLKYAGLIIIALVAAAGLVAGTSPGHTANIYTVNSTYGGPIPPATVPPATDFDPSDGVCETGPGNGICTLRAAIEQANSPTSLGLDTIAFNIPNTDPNYGPVTKTFLIQPSSALPVIADPVFLDGRTQPEFLTVGKPVIELNGLFAGSLVDGLRITTGGSGSTIRGLVIVKFGITNNSDGIEIQGGGNNTIEGNYIGVQVNGIVTDPDPFTGGDEYGNLGSGIFINGSSNNTIGGTRPGVTCVGASNPCNVISGGGRGSTDFNDAHGIEISGTNSTGNVIKGNIIGLDIGEAESGNLCIEAPAKDDDNDLAFNDGCPQVAGTAESGAECGLNSTDNDGDGAVNDGCPTVTGARKDIGNEGDGLNISAGASNNTIGGGAAGEGNVITSNDYFAGGGVRIMGGPEAGSACTGNTDNDGDLAVNDGCPQAGATAESGAQCANNANDDSLDDSLVNDGCPGVQVSSGNQFQGNYIGTTSTGATIPPPPASRQIFGVLIDGAPGNFFGAAGGSQNVVSGNLTGMQIQAAGATGNVVQRNYVGLDVTGAGDLGNQASGLVIANGASNNTVGGTAGGAGNVFSGNDNHGIEINSSATTGNMVQGNHIGTNAAGTTEVPNGLAAGGSTGRGIRINGAPANTIGGSSAARNVISGNIKYGIEIINGSASGNIVRSNYIGTDLTATSPVGNREAGIYVDGAPNTVIGGTTPDLQNVISGNGQASVLVVAQGIVVTGSGATGTQVQGNLIGTDINGTAALANLGIGVLIIGAPFNTVGGTAAGARNVISGNGIHGVEIDEAGATGNLVQGNHIGIDINGSAGLGNVGDGVFISNAPGNSVGGTPSGAANVVSSNGQAGVHVLGIGASANNIQGNFIGTDSAGGLDRGNSQHGIFIDGAPNNIIGGTSTAARNVVSGNNATGITIQDAGATGNLVRGNRIGTNAAGSGDLGNTSDGVRIGGNASTNSIGGTAAGATNTIAFNGAGVVIDSGTGNSVLSNSIHTSDTLGINLGIDGQTTNDLGDGDTGANNLQNYPVLSPSPATESGLFSTTVAGSLNSTASTTFTLQFFWSDACDGSGFGEGANFLGSISVTTDGSGNAPFSQSLPTGGAGGKFVSATATDPSGNTSEFAQCVVAGIDPDADNDGVSDAVDNCPLVFNPAPQANTDGDTQGNACDADDDNDKVYDDDEANCGGNSTNAAIRPERTDLTGDDNLNGQTNEALPPGSENYDCDGDGFKGSAENSIFSGAGGRDQDPCGNNGWPADLLSTGASTNKLDIQDLASFVAPDRHLNTSPGNPLYSVRWDLVPGTTVGDHINVTDLAALTSGPTGYPAMFAPVPPATGGRAFGLTCPWP